MFQFRLPTLLLVTVLIAMVALAWTGHALWIDEGNLTILRFQYRLREIAEPYAAFSLPLTVVGVIGCIFFLIGYSFAKLTQSRTKDNS